MAIVFIVFTFAGTGYVIYNHGTVNAGYAAIPMALALACLAGYRILKK